VLRWSESLGYGTKENLLADLNWVTEKISSQVWALNLGTLGTTWSLLITSSLPENFRFTPRNVFWIFIPCLLSLLCEMAQYLSAYRLNRRLLAEMEQSNRTEFQYPANDILYKARQFFFRGKIVLTVTAALILVFTLVQKFG
jgi:hypothetical protein